jgi:predicted ferric reductase/cbb3-type cytochrome oxidase subunit 3
MIRQFGTIFFFICSIWILCYVCLGYTKSGKEWYEHLASSFFLEDSGPAAMNLAIPILLSGTIATICMYHNEGVQVASPFPRHLPSFAHRWYHQLRNSGGDTDFVRFNILFICCPLAFMVMMNIHRHLYGKELSLDDQLMEIGNTFGFVALVAMSYFLVPVARQSPILKLLNVNPAAAIKIHIWSGRIIIIGVILHGSFHIFRWKWLAGESIWAMLFPPIPCFSLSSESDFVPECVDEDTDCKCYDLLRNLTGIIALSGLLIIGFTSLNYVRRHHYHLFYLTHVMVAPTVLLVTILHYSKSIIYISPSLLYYVATSFPVFTEKQSCCSENGVKLTRVERIQSTSNLGQQECISLTLKVTSPTVDSFCAGQYIKLGAPQVSSVQHPFTINRVPESKDELRIIFRVMGNFTAHLRDRLINPVNDSLPIITIDGFHGPQNRINQALRHDVVVIVAGGIGITPYLSLIQDVHNFITSVESAVTKEVILHWICREQSLIDYAVHNYFKPLLSRAKSDEVKIKIVIHKRPPPFSVNEAVENQNIPRLARPVQSNGSAFCSTLYGAGSSCTLVHTLIATLTFTSISWLGLWSIMALYHYNNAKEEIVYRIFSPIFVIIIGLTISWITSCIFPIHARRDTMAMRLHEGAVFTRVDGGKNQDLEEGQSRDELSVESSPNASISLHQTDGPRPSVHTLLKHLDSARCPGLFMCGPAGMMKDLRNAADVRCSIRQCQRISGEPSIAVYEEKFEL